MYCEDGYIDAEDIDEEWEEDYEEDDEVDEDYQRCRPCEVENCL